MARIPLKATANCGDRIRVFIETPYYVFDVSFEVDEDGFVTEIGSGHLLNDNKTDADINIMIDEAFGVT